MRLKLWLWILGLLAICSTVGAVEYAPDKPPDRAQGEPFPLTTNDPFLREQISELQVALEQLSEQIAQYQEALDKEPSVARRSGLSTQLSLIQKDYDQIEQVLDQLLDEASAADWTTADEALKRARPFERSQEEASRREESLRERDEAESE